MANEIDYAAVLADLEARRAVLDAAIAGLRLLVGQGLTQGQALEAASTANSLRSDLGSRDGSEDREVVPGMFHGLSVSEAARKFLEMRKAKQRTKVIAEALQRGGIESISGNFYANVFTTLKRRKDFIKIGKSWALAEWHPNRAAIQEKPRKVRRGRKVQPKGPKLVKPSAPADDAGPE